jgi:hypothetical protein
MPTIRISDQNYQRLQQFAVPLQDTPNDALGRVLDIAELAKHRGLSAESTNAPQNRPSMTVDESRLDVKLAGRLPGRAVVAKEGSTMTRWELTRTGQRFWLTISGVPLLYLPPRELWPSDTDHKVVHHPTPRSGWDRYDHFYLHGEADVEYALKILADLESVNN